MDGASYLEVVSLGTWAMTRPEEITISAILINFLDCDSTLVRNLWLTNSGNDAYTCNYGSAHIVAFSAGLVLLYQPYILTQINISP